jgi:uncharacterized protein (DUF4415 family)
MKDQYDFSSGKRGAIESINTGKTKIAIYLDNEIIDWFREVVNSEGGGNYQTLINDVLRAYINNQNESLETMLRRILREELAK